MDPTDNIGHRHRRDRSWPPGRDHRGEFLKKPTLLAMAFSCVETPLRALEAMCHDPTPFLVQEAVILGRQLVCA